MGNCQKQQDEVVEPCPENDHLGPVHEVYVLSDIRKVTNYTWNQDYQGLFDYQTKEVSKKIMKINGCAILIREQDRFELVDDNINALTQQKIKFSQFRLTQKDNYYQISPLMIQTQNFSYFMPKLLWLVVSSLPKKVHKIKEKDILKLGKQKIRVREIAHADSNPSQMSQGVKLTKLVYENLAYQSSFDKQEKNIKQKQMKGSMSDATNSQNQQVCRICLDPGEYENPLITPCKCSGSVRYIHLNCLRTWLAKRLSVQKTQYCITINWHPLSCQMCKAPFKYRIYMDNKKFYTVDIPKPPRPYIILELMRKTSATNGKIFHFVSFANKNKILLGRRKDIDVRLSDDISISRAHSCIEYISEKKQFQISDNKSKFGTLVLIKKGVLIRPHIKGISFQIGPSIYSFQSFRGPSSQNFNVEQGQDDDYMAENLSDEDEEDQQQNQQDQLNSDQGRNQNPSNQQLQLLLQPRTSLQIQPV